MEAYCDASALTRDGRRAMQAHPESMLAEQPGGDPGKAHGIDLSDMDAVSREQSDVLDRLLVNMADTELNARMKALTDEKESLKAQIADAQQAEADLEEQAARRRQMWDSIMECAAGYTEFDNELVRQVIQKITVEDAETIHIHFRDSDVVLEQEVE